MKRARRVVSFIIAFIMLQCFITTSYAAGTYQVKYGSYAEELWKNGLFLGSNGSFNLDKPLTRAEGATMLVRLLGKEAEAKNGTYSNPFTDVPSWAVCYIGYCYSQGLIKGISDTEYGSENAMTAAQFLTLTLRALGYKDDVDFTYTAVAAKALEIKLIGDSCYEQYTTTDVFMRDNAVCIAYNTLNLTLNSSSKLLKDTITMPGQPAGPMPTLTESEAGKLSATSQITVDVKYAYNGIVTEKRYYMNGKQVAFFIDGGIGTIYNGNGWILEVTRSIVTRYNQPVPGAPRMLQTAAILSPKLLTISSTGKTYADFFSTQEWKNDPYIVDNNVESLINFIIDEMIQAGNNLRSAGYR